MIVSKGACLSLGSPEENTQGTVSTPRPGGRREDWLPNLERVSVWREMIDRALGRGSGYHWGEVMLGVVCVRQEDGLSLTLFTIVCS